MPEVPEELKLHTPGKYCQRCESDKAFYGVSFYNLDTYEHYPVPDMVMVRRPQTFLKEENKPVSRSWGSAGFSPW
jgi:hypothetical protein